MRRSRYTVEFNDGTKRVILAYSAESAAAYYVNVKRVTKGDYRKKTRHEAIKREGGFRMDRDAVNDAAALLGIKWPIDIHFHGRVGQTAGNYCLRGQRHRIMVKSYLTPQEASNTLWHELTHAMQAERAGGGQDWISYRQQNHRYPYSQRPMEHEANEMADQMRDIPLAF